MITLYLLPLLLLSVIPAYIAQTKGKSFGAWYVYGLFLLPISFVHSLILERDDRKCPHCAELVKLEATVCKHCNSKLEAHDPLEVISMTQEKITQEEMRKEATVQGLIFIFGAIIIGIILFYSTQNGYI